MKILIPILGFGSAGGNRVLSQLACEWIRTGHEVDFLCPSSSADPYFPTSAGILWCRPSGRLSRTKPECEQYGGPGNMLALYSGLLRCAANYDVILANHSLTAWPVALARAGRARKAYYVQAYEPELYLARRKPRATVAALLSALSYHLPLLRIVNAPIYCRYRNLRARHAVPPGLDLTMFRPAQTCRDLAAVDEIVVGCIGRKEAEKGTIYAVRAFETLHARDPRYRLRIAYHVPEGWTHPAAELVLPRNDAELAEFYRSLDVIVAPATGQHGAPHYPVLEGGASGVPVVTTGYLGATPETAWLVTNRDAQSIVQAIGELVSQPQARERKRALFLNSVQEFKWASVSARMLALLMLEDKR